jgi:hypothetical protein
MDSFQLAIITQKDCYPVLDRAINFVINLLKYPIFGVFQWGARGRGRREISELRLLVTPNKSILFDLSGI